MPSTPIPISALPAAPDRADRATFSARAVAMFSALKDVFVGEVNAIAITANTNATEAAASASAAAASVVSAALAQSNAQQAANAAATAAGAALWVSGTTYALGDAVWSPITYLIYRRILSGAGTTDPSADATHWGTLGSLGLTVVTVTGTAQTATAGSHYVLTNAAATTVTLPAGASGDTVAVTCTGALATNVIAPNGAETIMEVAGSMTLDKAGATITLKYLQNSWRII